MVERLPRRIAGGCLRRARQESEGARLGRAFFSLLCLCDRVGCLLSIADWVCDPATDGRLAPACTVYTDPHLTRECALGYLAVDRRRSEEHTSELQSLMRSSYAVFCLKKKKKTNQKNKRT